MENDSSLIQTASTASLLVYPVATADYLAQLAFAQIDSYNRANRKNIPQKLVDKAISNQPYQEVWKGTFTEKNTNEDIAKGLTTLKAGFLSENFMMLADNGINFDTPVSEVEKFVNSKLASDKTFAKHLEGLKKCFIGFQTVFNFVAFLQKCNKFSEKHLQALYSYTSSFAAINDVQRAAPMMVAINALLTYNQTRYICNMPMILSNNCLVEIALAMPVWYMQSQNYTSASLASIFFNTVGSAQFTTLLQLYNLNINNRSIQGFPTNPDPVPSSYTDFFDTNSSLFQNRLIATPYHSIASNEWQAPVWKNNIDPASIAFFSSLPFFMITHQWSGDGILRHAYEMIGDTINHLDTNRKALASINQNHDWFDGKNTRKLGNDKKFIFDFADQLIEAFDEGRAISFLKGQ
jgi:hypothetical protein